MQDSRQTVWLRAASPQGVPCRSTERSEGEAIACPASFAGSARAVIRQLL